MNTKDEHHNVLLHLLVLLHEIKARHKAALAGKQAVSLDPLVELSGDVVFDAHGLKMVLCVQEHINMLIQIQLTEGGLYLNIAQQLEVEQADAKAEEE